MVYVSDFLRELVMLLPGTVHSHVSIILPHLSSRPYQIRTAVVFSVAEVLAAAHEKELEAKAGGMSEVLAQKRGEGGEGGSQASLHAIFGGAGEAENRLHSRILSALTVFC